MSFPGGASGSTSNVAIPALNITALPVTIELWFMPEATQSYYATLLYNRNASSNSGLQYDRWNDATKVKLVWANTQPSALHPNKPIAGQWNHLAVVITSTTKTMYLNGVAQTENGTFANYPMDGTTYLGWDNAVDDRTFKGLIDEVRIWGTARTSDEISQNKFKTLTGSESGLLGYWNFNDQASQATDLSSNGRNGIITGASYVQGFDNSDLDNDGIPAFLDNCPNTQNPDQADIDLDGIGDVCDQLIVEKTDNALYLPGINGTNSQVNISGLNLKTLPFTMEMWIKPEGTQTYNAGLLFNTTSNVGFQYASSWYSPANSIRFMAKGGDQYAVPTTIDAVASDKWNHIAIVMTESSRTVYLNGVAKTESASFQAIDWSTGNTYLGYDSAGTSRAFKGQIDEVRVWNTARTYDEIDQNKFETLIGNENGLVGYWNFNDKASTATDLSVNSNNGTIKGGLYVPSTLLDPMEYVASSATQRSLTVDPKTADIIVMTVKINTKNESSPLKLSKLNISTNGSTNHNAIEKIRVFSTGTEVKFTSKLLIAETSTLPEENFTLDCDHTLKAGSNYFQMVYVLNDHIANNNQLDAECISFELANEDSAFTIIPNITAPAGKITIDTESHISTVTTEAAKFSGNIGTNFVAFQQSAIITYKAFQYLTYWNNAFKVCVARRAIPNGKWQEVELPGYTINQTHADDNHYNISMGICEKDGTIHLSYDHHNDPLRYRVSVVGLANDSTIPWSAESFGPHTNNLGNGVLVSFDGNITYPRFVSMPNGNLLFEARSGTSGDGNSHLWEYNGASQQWTYVGEYMHGRTGTTAGYTNKCGYINGLHYTPGGNRLHVSFIWRETPNPPSNHDLYYAYSDDNGRTWFNDAGVKVATTGTDPLHFDKTSLKIMGISENRGLINQESQTVDKNGKIHILQSFMLESEANSTDWYGSRQKAYMRHIYKDENGIWQKDPIDISNINRSQIAVDGNNNLYVVAPNYRVYTAKSSEGWKTWKSVDLSGSTKAISEGQIDREMLLNHNILQFAFPSSENNGKILIPSYEFDQLTLLPENLKDKDIRIYPNPSPTFFQIDSQNNYNYQIFDQVGKMIEKGNGNHNSQIGLKLTQGTYFIQINQDEIQIVSKLIKI